MHRQYLIVNAVLWATAIVTAALAGAPAYLSAIVLPILASASLLVVSRRRRAASCRHA
jgi:hypothetical protein